MAMGSPFGNGTYAFAENGESLDFRNNESLLWSAAYESTHEFALMDPNTYEVTRTPYSYEFIFSMFRLVVNEMIFF